MIEYRMVADNEVQQLAAFAIEGMQPHRYPLHVSRFNVVALIRLIQKGEPHFGLAAVRDGEIVGAIAAFVTQMAFFERCEAHVVMCRAVAPGVGRKLISALRSWVDADMKIRRVQFPIEEFADPRIGKLLKRYGFDRVQTNAMYYKG